MTYRPLRSLILCLALLWSLGKPEWIHAETGEAGAPEETNAKGKQANPAAPTLSLKLQAAGSPAVVGVKHRIAADPFNWRLYTELGAVFYKEGRYDESIAAYQQALAMNPFSRTIEAERQQVELVAAQRQAHEQQQAAQA
ncbi:MAG: tetratricopeptide repeat protein, partial [Candidatus Binatia bacterium]